MIVYNPQNKILKKERMQEAECILNAIPAKYCFITGSFLYKEKYNDIDVFVVSRTKKQIQIPNKKAKITILDFNDLYSLFYHSITKSCIAKNILPIKPLKVTLSDYWHVINEAVPAGLNKTGKKDMRLLVLYTEYFKNGTVLDTVELAEKIIRLNNTKEILKYIQKKVPEIINMTSKKTYLKKFFYTQAGFYKNLREYKAQDFLYNLTHAITRGISHG
jgi:hypothetical protein